jgi:hypothetical protein
MLLGALDASPFFIIHEAVTHPASMQGEADWIRRIGVAVAVAGTLVAAPDGTALVWARVVGAGERVRRALAAYLPFLRRPISVSLKSGADVGYAAHAGTVQRRVEWIDTAAPDVKIDLLHQQVDMLAQEIAEARQEARDNESALRAEIAQAEARAGDRHKQLAGRLDAEQRRAARVDARGIWLIGAGIVLTGIPAELAGVPVVGWLVAAAAVLLTLRMVFAVRADFRAR